MSDHKQCILWLLYKVQSRRALDVEEIRKKCRIKERGTALKLCRELQQDGKIIGAKTQNGWVFWSDFTEHLEHAIRLPLSYKHQPEQPEQTDVGTISLSNSPITDGVIQARKSPTRGE